MPSEHLYDHFRHQVKPALKSKLEEFHLLGYDTIDEGELWFFLTKKKWKKPSSDYRIAEIVQDVMNVKVVDFMNFATLEAYKAEDYFATLTSEEKKELLK
ncbi:post-transcriptional regulator [Niallia circulans]|uniref:Post-transcriptional regulator n=1 Tax=Niallia circulans TaxID=1397 RepID=A0A553SKG2_NIACI|nr:post-transcriptional regulator [Niallia circulans]TRZ37452.1 post-transcriptional regulator [Niallia circulans]